MLGVIIAAGDSTRMGSLTFDKPKCLLDVNGKAIIDWQLEAFQKAGIKNILIIRGYEGKKLSPIRHKYEVNYRTRIQFCWNNLWITNDILGSLMTAREFIEDEDFICCYSDILFKFFILDILKSSISPLVLAYDTRWMERYKFRSKHPISEAEFIGIEKTKEGDRLKIGKGIEPRKAIGEFTGIAKFSRNIWPEIIKNAEMILTKNPKAYLTDLLTILIQNKSELRDISIYGGYFEIDTKQDLDLARLSWK